MTQGLKALAVVFVVAVLQGTVFSTVEILGGTPDAVLVAVVALALLRGPVTGALCGFLGGLVLDVANLQTLGVTSLLLVLLGYWAGRYAESAGRERRPAPYLPVVAATVLYALGALVVRALLGDAPSAQLVLVDSLFPSMALNVLVAAPVWWLLRRTVRPLPARPAAPGPGGSSGGGSEVELVG